MTSVSLFHSVLENLITVGNVILGGWRDNKGRQSEIVIQKYFSNLFGFS